MKTTTLLLATLLWGAFSAVQANEATPAPGRIVKNAPYSAEAVTERTQTLTDGNQISSRQSTMSYRDSAGRTRQDIQNANGELNTIRINDPVEAVSYVLNTRQKTAVRIARPAPPREQLEPLRKEAREAIVIRNVERTDALNLRSEQNVHVRPSPEGLTISDPDGRIKTVITGALGDMRWARKSTLKDLGSKEIDGVKAQGKLRSYEIPAGEVGNRNPILVTQENWYSPELQVTVYSKHSDPRTGERTYRLASIKRDEPAPALFTVPADYTFKSR